MIKYKAIIFGSIGTLAETSDIQRKSFNKAFKNITEGIYDVVKKQGHYGRNEMIQCFGQWPGQSWVQNIDGLGVANKLKEIDEKANRS